MLTFPSLNILCGHCTMANTWLCFSVVDTFYLFSSIFSNIWEKTVLLMGAPAVGFPVELQRVVRAEYNPCSCFAVLSLCIFRLWLSVNSIQAVLLGGRAWQKPPYQFFFSQTFISIHTRTFFMVSKTQKFVLMHVVPSVFQHFKLWGFLEQRGGQELCLLFK